jgi:hypothetical protein
LVTLKSSDFYSIITLIRASSVVDWDQHCNAQLTAVTTTSFEACSIEELIQS